VVRRIIEDLGGRIELDPTEAGVSFSVWLYARHPKSERGTIARMSFGSTIGDIEVDGAHYKGDWSDDVKSFSGTIQWPGPAARSAVPS
jgi:hypothetical protein